jgi:hypothetical protein
VNVLIQIEKANGQGMLITSISLRAAPALGSHGHAQPREVG